MKNKQKAALRLLAALLALTLLAPLGLTASAADGPDTIYIDSASDFVSFAKSCALDTWSAGKTVILRADISLAGMDYTPVAAFGGTFDGQGHAIRGLTLTAACSPTGLIGTIQNMIGSEVIHTERTTPESFELQGLLRRMADAGCTHVVMEVSSHSLTLERVAGIHFDVALYTNLSQDHLDFHGTMEEYISAKKNIFLHQGAFTATVLNADCPTTAGFAAEVRGDCRWFSRRHPVERGAWLDEAGTLHYTDGKGDTPLFAMSEIKIPGLHNVENMLTAIAAVWGLVPPEVIRHVANTFPGVEHRIEFVRELDGVRWYNDSIATSPTRTIAGLESFDQKLIIIAGGYDKHLDYTPLAGPVLEHVKALILTGATADKIEKAVTSHPGYAQSGLVLRRAATLDEAVAIAHSIAEAGDIVSLSPASASFDCYPNFEVRGQCYKALVNGLK